MAARRAGVFITSDCAHVSRARTNPDPLLSGQLRVARTFLAAQGFQRRSGSGGVSDSRGSVGLAELRIPGSPESPAGLGGPVASMTRPDVKARGPLRSGGVAPRNTTPDDRFFPCFPVRDIPAR